MGLNFAGGFDRAWSNMWRELAVVKLLGEYTDAWREEVILTDNPRDIRD
jgi:hypothetical protein